MLLQGGVAVKRNRPVNRGDFIVKPQAVFLSLAVERGNRKVSG